MAQACNPRYPEAEIRGSQLWGQIRQKFSENSILTHGCVWWCEPVTPAVQGSTDRRSRLERSGSLAQVVECLPSCVRPWVQLLVLPKHGTNYKLNVEIKVVQYIQQFRWTLANKRLLNLFSAFGESSEIDSNCKWKTTYQCTLLHIFLLCSDFSPPLLCQYRKNSIPK
jgi:hypothetical protein